jgi:hypothetical protein
LRVAVPSYEQSNSNAEEGKKIRREHGEKLLTKKDAKKSRKGGEEQITTEGTEEHGGLGEASSKHRPSRDQDKEKGAD